MRHQQALHLVSTDLVQLQPIISAHSTSQALATRARIIVAASSHPTWNSRILARSIGVNDRLVRKGRRRWEETHCLGDLPRSGGPRKSAPEVRASVTALACSLPRSFGVPLARWSRAELARHLVRTSPLPAPSARTIGRWLTAEQIRPWRFHSWQHIQDPETFLQRARPVLQLYEQARSLLQEGIWVVCVDEKTSIQAREAEQAPCPPIPKHILHQSPRYHRRGALHLMAGLSVADGYVYGCCSSRKRFVDFTAFLQTVLIAQAKLRKVHTVALILDNGSTHAPKRFPRWLEEQSLALDKQLAFQVYWL